MAKGKIHKYYYYPGCIGLMNEWFLLDINNIKYAVAIKRHVKGLEIYDLDNSVIIDNNGNAEFKRKINIKDLPYFHIINHKDMHDFIIGFNAHGEKRIIKNYYFTELLICKEVDDIISYKPNYSEFENVLTKFILYYKMAAKDKSIKMPSESNISIFLDSLKYYEYTKDDLELEVNERLKIERQSKSFLNNQSSIILDNNEIELGKIPKHNAIEIGKNLKSLLENNTSDEHLYKLLIAYDKLELDKDPKMILLELFIYTETQIYQYIKKRKIDLGVSKNKLKDYETEVGIGYMINIELPMLIPEIDSNTRQVIGELDKVRKLRNKIVHNNFIPTKKEVVNAIKSIEKFLSYIHDL